MLLETLENFNQRASLLTFNRPDFITKNEKLYEVNAVVKMLEH